MKRQIIRIDTKKCTGCGLCVSACHEGALEMRGGKAVLVRDDYCDGLGNCLPACPAGAITFETREALPFSETRAAPAEQTACGCPGSAPLTAGQIQENASAGPQADSSTVLSNWPIQLKLTPAQSPSFDGADILIAADCTAFAYPGFRNEFLNGRICLIACPKLDGADYTEKLSVIFAGNDIRSVTVVRMEVPCCAGIVRFVQDAAALSGKRLSVGTVVIGISGTRTA